MSKKFYVFGLLILNAVLEVTAFNYSALYDTGGSHRDGKFLFDSLFGLEFEEELISNDGVTNSLKSCDCGE